MDTNTNTNTDKNTTANKNKNKNKNENENENKNKNPIYDPNTHLLSGMTGVRDSVMTPHWHQGELENTDAKVVILGATFHTINVRTHISLMEMMKPMFAEVVCPGRAQDAGRNAALIDAMQFFPEATHFLFLDYDEIFPAYMLDFLLRDEKPIVSGWYLGSSPTYRPCVYEATYIDSSPSKNPHDERTIENMAGVSVAQITKAILNGVPLQEGWYGGLGATLVKKEAMDAFFTYWIDRNQKERGEENLCVPFQQMFDQHGRLIVGEDHRFYAMCREAGIPYWIDCSIMAGHQAHVYLPTHLAGWTDTENNHTIFKDNVRFNLADTRQRIQQNPEILMDLSPTYYEQEITWDFYLKTCKQDLIKRGWLNA